MLVEFTELALQNRPELGEVPADQQSTDRVRVLRLEDVRAREAGEDKNE